MQKKLHYYSILNNLNFLFFLICIFFYFKFKFLEPDEIHKYIDYKTYIYGAAISLEGIFFNQFFSKKFNPLIFILTASTFIYYQLRILTLSYFNYSSVISRNTSEILLNETLIFIICTNFFIFLGIYLSKKYLSTGAIKIINKNNFVEKKLGYFLIFIFLLIILNNLNSFNIDTKFILFPYLRFFNPIYFIFAAFCFIAFIMKISNNKMHYWNNLFLILLVVLALCNALLLTLHGSRSGIFSLLEFIVIIYLVFDQKVEFKLKHITILLFSIILLLFFFIFATKIRLATSTGAHYFQLNSFDFYYNLFKNSQNTIKEFFAMLADRIGHLDYATDLISNNKKYEIIFNFKFYLKSIIDNMTPGFDIYDIPQISQSIKFVYYNLGYPSKYILTFIPYHTDELTFYGEIFNIAGYYSIIIALLVGVFFQYLYNCIYSSTIHFYDFIWKVFILYAFYLLLLSFGFDSFLYQITYISLIFLIFTFLMKKRDV